MSYYIQNDGEIGPQIGSNSGFGDFTKWLETLGSKKYPEVSALCDDGMSVNPTGLIKELGAIAKDETPPDSDVGDILRELREIVDAKYVVAITDGFE